MEWMNLLQQAGTPKLLQISLYEIGSYLAPLILLFGASFAFVFFWGSPFLQLLKRYRVGQTVREDGPQTHLVKSGTPTFGGVLFVIFQFFIGLLFCIRERTGFLSDPLVFLFAVLAFAAIGFADDYVKVRITREGLSVLQKSVGMLLVCILLSFYLVWGRGDCYLLLPFSPYMVQVVGFWKFLYALFLVVFLYFCTNAANLTDGVDGLLATLASWSLLAILPLSFLVRVPNWLVMWNVTLSGGCQGFLIFNRHPARIFMGDVGSLSLGAALCMTPAFLGLPWLYLFFGLVYILEALSVVIQVSYFKATGGKRIFRMSPIHHHFELGGWKEKQVVRRFLTFELVFLLLGLFVVSFVR